MKKTFRFLALGFALICGTLSSFASSRPTDGTRVGQMVSGGVVTYSVMAPVPGDEIAQKATYKGKEYDCVFYPVEILGLDFDGLNDPDLKVLNVSTSFVQKDGEELNGYYVKRIIDAQGENPSAPGYKKAFWAATNLTDLKFAADEGALPEDKFNFEVGNYSFYGCSSLATLTLPDNVTRIGKYAFQDTKIGSFTIPANCAVIGEFAFNNATDLDEVKVSTKGNKDLKNITSKVFANSSVKTLDLSNAIGLEMIADDAFIYSESVVNNQLATIVLPALDATHVNGHTNFILYDGTTPNYTKGIAFANLTGLTSIQNLEISYVQTIANGAFENCENLPILNFPKWASITATPSGGTSAFLNCPKLKTLTFAAGWEGTIGSNIYLSGKGNKVVDKNGVTKFETYTLTEADLKKELSYLENIEFKGAWGPLVVNPASIIGAYAFGNADPKKACSGLKSVKFGGIIYEGTTIDNGAFQNCAALATLTFNGFHMSTTSNDILINPYSFAGTAITEVDFKDFQLNGDNSANKQIKIQENAFAADNLKKVTFGNITWGKAWNATDKEYKDNITTPQEFQVMSGAFVSDALTEVVFGNITACSGADIFTIGNGVGPYYPAFGSKTWNNAAVTADATRTGVLQKVTIGNIAAGNFIINSWAFASEALTDVEIGNILTPAGISGALTINPYAFSWTTSYRGSSAQEKSVKIGAINAVHTADVTNNTLGVEVLGNAFAGDKLKSVTIGAITDEYTTFTAALQSFANTMENTDDFEAMTETVNIGDLDKAKVTFPSNAFQGPAKEDSKFTVTIGKLNLGSGSAIQSNAFKAPSVGSASYTLGDIEKTDGIGSWAFAGSKDKAVEGKTNTSVKIGDYKAVFVSAATFTNVNDLTAEAWPTASTMTKFTGIRKLTVNGDVAGQINGGDENTLETIILKGAKISGKIGANYPDGFGKAVRHIEFANADPDVVAGAIQKNAFKNASDNAANAETISVVYRVKTAKKSNSIFNVEAFGSNDTYKNVVLYTDKWSSDNTFKNIELVGNPGHIYRMQLSASDVAPGEDIVANCITGANGKYAYGRLYVPAGTGMLYKVDAKYDDATKKNGVNLFYANISGTNIYMNTVRQMDGYYWIDANEVAQTLIVRTSEAGAAAVEVKAESVTADEKAEMAAEGTVVAKDWFGATWAEMNDLQYATEDIPNTELQNNTKFKKKGIYVMANPKKYNLAFALLDQYNKKDSEGKNLNMYKGSVYVVTRADQYAARLNVIWPEDDEENAATAIQSVKTVESNDAIYNLQGVRLNKAQKGINIINGKKVIK